MELYLQFGWGMKKLVLDFAKRWKTVNVILSPRDISPEQLVKWSQEFKKNNVDCFFDPQCYYPKSNHKRLSKYNYWDNSMSTNLGTELNYDEELISDINYYNDIIGTRRFIIPSFMRKYEDNWIDKWEKDSEKLINASMKIVRNKERLLTLALPSDILCQTEDNIEKIIRIAEKFDVDGYYIVAEPPNGQYLVDNPLWLSNLLQLCAGLKLLNKKVIVGYANQQLLCLSTAKVDAIASGTFLNVRRFSNKFEEPDRSIKRKSIWYYYPESLSEYKMGFLDVAFNNRVLDELKPQEELENDYINLIFSGIMPQTTAFNETLAFRHYLESLRRQAALCSRGSFEETISANEMLLETAERRLEFLEDNGIYAQSRCFRDIIDVNRSTIQRLQKTRGFLLKYSWNEL